MCGRYVLQIDGDGLLHGYAATGQDRAAHWEAVHRLLAAISNNVNQIARATNATGEVQDEMHATLDAIRRTASRIDEVVDGMSH